MTNIWVADAVGIACGPGILFMGLLIKALYLLALFVIAPLVRRLPGEEGRRHVRPT